MALSFGRGGEREHCEAAAKRDNLEVDTTQNAGRGEPGRKYSAAKAEICANHRAKGGVETGEYDSGQMPTSGYHSCDVVMFLVRYDVHCFP